MLFALTLLLGFAPAYAAEPYELNAIVPLTGPYVFAGQEEKAAIEALAASANKKGGIGGRPLRVVFNDDQSNPQIAVQLANAIVAKKAPAFLGPAVAGSCNAVAPLISNTSGPLMYCFATPQLAGTNPFVFGGQLLRNSIATSLRYLRAKKYARIAVLNSIDATGQDADRSIDDLLATPENRLLILVAREHFSAVDLVVTGQLERIKAAKPDVLIVWTVGTPLGTVLRGLKDTGMTDIPVVTSGGNASLAEMQQFGAYLPKELLIASSSVLAQERVTDRMTLGRLRDMTTAMAPTKPDSVQLFAWDPALIVIEALRKLGPDATAEQLRSSIAGQTRFVGAAGPYNFQAIPGRGLDQSAVYMVRWDSTRGTFVAVSNGGGQP